MKEGGEGEGHWPLLESPASATMRCHQLHLSCTSMLHSAMQCSAV